MDWLGWLLYGVVALWLAPGAIWRPVALALLLQWFVAEVAFVIAGDFSPLWIYIPGDILVILAVFFRRSHITDLAVIVPYPAVWWLYMQPMSQEVWLWMYWISLFQFVMAGPWRQVQKINDKFFEAKPRKGRASVSYARDRS